MIKLIIFDYDGLLVESEKLAFCAEEKILRKYGKPLTKDLFDKYLGYSVIDTLKAYDEYHNLSISIDDFYAQREAMINTLLEKDLILKPGAKILLDYLHKKKITMVIGSSGERSYIETGLKILDVKKYFKNITCVSEVKRGKPNPDLFLEALRKNHTKAEGAIVLEDAISGIKAAKSANIFCITVPPLDINIQGHRIADIVVDNLEKVKDMFENFQTFS